MFRYNYITYYLNKIIPEDITNKILNHIYPILQQKQKSLLDNNKPFRYYHPYNNSYEMQTNIIVSVCKGYTIQRCISCGHIMIAIIETNNCHLKIIDFSKYDCNCSSFQDSNILQTF